MPYLTGSELHGFHDSFLRALKKQSLSQSDEEWGYPSGFEICDTFSFRTEHGKFTVGHGSISTREFFEYYRANPGKWQLMQFNGYDYLKLAKIGII